MADALLKDIGLYKRNIISALIKSEDFCQVMLGKNYTQADVDGLMYHQIFPYLFIDGVQTEVLPYLCVEVNVNKVMNSSTKDMVLTVWAYSHNDCMRCTMKGYVGTRIDIICDIFERVLHDSDNFGIGKMSLQSVRYIFPTQNYYGREMTLHIPDFRMKEIK